MGGDDKARVLIVEDDPLVARSLKLVLRKHQPILVDSISALKLVLPDVAPTAVVLSDLSLTDGGGDLVFEVLQSRRPELIERLFWLTGGGSSETTYAATIVEAGRPVIYKPVSPTDLRELVEGALMLQP